MSSERDAPAVNDEHIGLEIDILHTELHKFGYLDARCVHYLEHRFIS